MSLEHETTNAEGRSRKRLKPLLQKLLNDNNIPGLCWRDRASQIWQMPWKHHKQTRWGDPDALMLRELAKGMYNYQGPDEPSQERLKQWKELLRNALRSLKDVKELKDLHVVDGKRPYKVYQFVDKSEGARRCPARDTERRHRNTPIVTVHCNNSSESFPSPTDQSNLQEHASVRRAPPAVISTQSPFCGTIFQINAPQLINFHSPSNDQTTSQLHHPDPSMVRQVVCINEDADILSGNLTENVDDFALHKLMSEFNLDNFRSRSPLCQNNEPGMEIHEISVNDVELLNDIPQSSTGVCDSAVTAAVNNLPEMPPCNRSRGCTGASRSTEFIQQNVVGNEDCKKAENSRFNFSFVETIHRLQDVGNTAIGHVTCIQNRDAQCQPYLMRDAALASFGPHGLTTLFIGETSALSSDTYQQSCPSINSILGSAPMSSVFVAVYYNTNQIVKSQVFTGTFRICFVPDDETRESIMTCQDPKQFGPNHVDLLELPEIRKNAGLSPQARDTNKILNNLTRGIIIDLRDKNIYATRYCKAVAHFCIPGQTEFTKMERCEEVKIFDFCKYFQNSFDPRYRYQISNPLVRLSFAVKDANRKASALSMDIWHTEAYRTKLQGGENAHSLEADCSLSDEYDRRVEIELSLRKTTLHY